MGLRFVLLWAATAAVAGVLDFIGRDVGITSQTMLTEDQAARVLEDAREGHADSLHFSALLHLYGKGGVKQNSYKALDIFKAAAAKGHAASQVALGVMLRHGHGTTRDDKAAFAWFAAAARQGHVEGMWLLGVMHVEGLGTTAPDYGEARKWLRLSAQTAKSPDAMHWLGVMEEYGLGSVEANLTAAVEWYTKSHRAGHVTSAFHLGLMHAYGRGVNQDHARGMLLFQDAVAKGHAGAMYYLGVMALYGQGMPVNYDMARLWFQKAEAKNDASVSDAARLARVELEHLLDVAAQHARAVVDDCQAQNDEPG